MKKKEILLIIGMLVIAGLFYIFFSRKQEGSFVRISIDGKEYQTLPLEEDRTIVLEQGQNKNVIRIEQEQVFMQEASCPDHLCMKQGNITMAKQMIVCLPHRVVVEILAEQPEIKIDAVVN